MEDNFSANIKDVIGFSRDEAIRLSNNYIGTEHFILGIIKLKNAGAVNILNTLGIEILSLKEDIENFATSKSTISINTTKDQIQLKKEAEKALKTTFLEARVFNSSMIGTTHLLLCILQNSADSTTKFLNNYNITYERVKEAFIKELESEEYYEQKEEDPKIKNPHQTKASISEEDDSKHVSKRQVQSNKTKSNTPVLDNFGRDL
ncbi:MAG: Clp protease ClpC, partial [Flavobacteriales bacterium]|nr:Clp protease ClpC [Flavobacteriales bacterium]